MRYQPSSRQRTELPFHRDEWDLLVRLPGRVVVAATLTEADSHRRTVAEGLAGIEAIAAGRSSASQLVREIVSAIYAEEDDDAATVDEPRYRIDGIAAVVADCRKAVRILAERVALDEADAYAHWLESIAGRVCQAARSGGVPGIGGILVGAAERRFLIDLSAALRG